MKPNVREILLIESHDDVRSVLRESLEYCGFRVWMATDGLQGIELLREGVRPDVIVSDLAIRGKTNLSFLAQIKEDFPSIAFVALTGSEEHQGRPFKEFATDIGADAVLEKPFNIEDLENVITSLVHF